MTTKAEFGEQLREGLGDRGAQQSRRHLIDAAVAFLNELGGRLWIRGELGSAGDQGVSVLAQIIAELANGAVAVLDHGQAYAAAALTRQLVEAEYLAWTFAEEPAMAAQWMRSSPAELRSKFQPKNLRQRAKGRFRPAQYWDHCSQGGHPSPTARLLLRYRPVPLDPVESVRADLCKHLADLVPEIALAAKECGLKDGIPIDLLDAALEAIAIWRTSDSLARLAIPDDQVTNGAT